MSIGLSNEDTGMEEMQAEGRGRDEICKSRLKMDRYIGVGFWRTLTSEVEGLREAINDDSDETEEEDNADYPDTATKTQRRLPAMLFDSSFHAPEDLKTLHPSPMVINKLTELFIANVDPMCKFMHVPTLNAPRKRGSQAHDAALFASISVRKVTSPSLWEWAPLVRAELRAASRAGECRGTAHHRNEPAGCLRLGACL